MSDLIDRDALEAKIRENSMRIQFFEPSVNVILQLIRYAPAVKAEPVRHDGRLIPPPYGSKALHRCSACGEEIYQLHVKFCGNCGARLDGGADNG